MNDREDLLIDNDDINLYNDNIKNKHLVSKKRKHELKRRNDLRKMADAGINREFHFEKSWCGPEYVITGDHAKMTQLSGKRVYLKKQANRKLRRTKKIYNRGQYKRVYDLLWELY